MSHSLQLKFVLETPAKVAKILASENPTRVANTSTDIEGPARVAIGFY